MTKQIRSNIFETNSSSVHTYTSYYKPEKLSLGEYLKSVTNDDNIVRIDLNWYTNEDGDLAPDNKLSMIFSSIPDFYVNEETDEVTISKSSFLENPTVRAISVYIENKYNIKLMFKDLVDDAKENVWLQRVSRGYNFDYLPVLDDLYTDGINLIIDFLEDTSYRMNVSEEYDG